jgi:DUF1707 SHOCT-like domain
MVSSSDLVPESVPPAARERAVEVLSRQFAADELTEAALEARLQRVYAATTQSELNAVIDDLPTSLASDRVPARPGPAVAKVRALFSGQERTLTGEVPRELRLRARLGYIEMDLTRARFEPGLTTIDARAFMGYVQIRLPADVHVENEGRALFGFFSSKGGSKGGDPGTHAGPATARSTVRITGRAVFGFGEAIISRRPIE